MGIGVDILHEVFFQLSPGERLSGRLSLDPWLAILVPLGGGIIFGIASEVIARWRPEREVDPIEANALHGGRMSLIGSMIVAAQTMWSSGGGAAAGIAGAFGAPLPAAFYGFELIIGSYSPTSLAPVGISALIGFLVANHFSAAKIGVVAPEKTTIAAHDLVLAATLGLLAAMLGIILMRGVAICEAMFTRSRLRPTLRTAAGGLVVGVIAILSPQVMSSGHGALRGGRLLA